MKKNQVWTEEQLEKMLPTAVKLAAKQEKEEWEKERPHQFSEGFERKMTYLIAHGKPKSYGRYVGIAAQIILIVGITLGGFTMGVEGFRIRAFEILMNMHTQYTQLIFKAEKHNEFELYEPFWLPEGYVKTEVNQTSTVYEVIYSNGEVELTYLQMSTSDYQSHRLDTQETGKENLQIGSLSVEYVSKDGIQTLVWYRDYYAFQVQSEYLTKEELISVLKSTQKVSKEK